MLWPIFQMQKRPTFLSGVGLIQNFGGSVREALWGLFGRQGSPEHPSSWSGAASATFSTGQDEELYLVFLTGCESLFEVHSQTDSVASSGSDLVDFITADSGTLWTVLVGRLFFLASLWFFVAAVVLQFVPRPFLCMAWFLGALHELMLGAFRGSCEPLSYFLIPNHPPGSSFDGRALSQPAVTAPANPRLSSLSKRKTPRSSNCIVHHRFVDRVTALFRQCFDKNESRFSSQPASIPTRCTPSAVDP